MPSGIILKGIGGFYFVKSQDDVYRCKARGIFRKDGLTPLPGDRVSISVDDYSSRIGNIDEILPRESELVRPAVSNINQLVSVIAVKSPGADLTLLDKLLITAMQKEISAIICVNKIDLDDAGERQNMISEYEKAGYRVIELSSKNACGFEQLREALNGKISVFSGQSGVGKSTILNIIMDSMIMKTGEISSRVERGKHTTRHAELIELAGGGYIVDTPGFSSFELTGVHVDALERCYPEFADCLGGCRFTGCSHISEPGCSVKDALSKGIIGCGRYERYIQFHNYLKLQKSNEYKKQR